MRFYRLLVTRAPGFSPGLLPTGPAEILGSRAKESKPQFWHFYLAT